MDPDSVEFWRDACRAQQRQNETLLKKLFVCKAHLQTLAAAPDDAVLIYTAHGVQVTSSIGPAAQWLLHRLDKIGVES